jgi:GNAT superfamily N-acetyltransferase
MDITVRKATPEDIDKMLPLTRTFHHAAKFSDYSEWNPEKWGNWLSTCIENDSGLCLVATNGTDIPIGLVTAVALPSYWDNDVKVCQETVLFCVPEHRGSGVGTKLVEALAEWGREKNCSVLAVGTQQNMAPKKTGQFYKKLGFELSEKAFARRL